MSAEDELVEYEDAVFVEEQADEVKADEKATKK